MGHEIRKWTCCPSMSLGVHSAVYEGMCSELVFMFDSYVFGCVHTTVVCDMSQSFIDK